MARGDLAALEAHGLCILDRDGQEAPLAVATAEQFRALGWRFWQPPGEDIHRHDSNERRKFRFARRAFSLSCVRVEKYEALAAWALHTDGHAIQERIATGRTHWESVRPVPVAIVDLTALPDDNGAIRCYPDVYGHDAADLQAVATTVSAVSGSGPFGQAGDPAEAPSRDGI